MRELDRGVAQEQLGEQRAGVAAAADDAGGGERRGAGHGRGAGQSLGGAGGGAWICADRGCHEALRVHVGMAAGQNGMCAGGGREASVCESD